MGPSISRYSPRRPKSNIGNEALLRSRSFPTYSSLPAAPSASDTRRLTGSMQRIGTKRPVSTGLAIRMLCSPVPRATGSIFGTNLGMAQRAGEFTAADLAKRLQLCRRLVCVGRSRPIAAMLGASFGSEPETPTLHGTRARREAPGRSDRPFRIWERGPRERWERGTTFVYELAALLDTPRSLPDDAEFLGQQAGSTEEKNKIRTGRTSESTLSFSFGVTLNSRNVL